MKENEKRDAKQEEREKNYQKIIEQLTEKFSLLDEVRTGISEIRNYIFTKEDP